MLRKIIQIDEAKCNGCGACTAACHEGAIDIDKGKARLLRDDYCDGLGDCLPACPTGAISFIEREAAAYNEVAVQQHQLRQGQADPGSTPKADAAATSAALSGEHLACGCPGSLSHELRPRRGADVPGTGQLAHCCPGSLAQNLSRPYNATASEDTINSQLCQWPVQIKLVAINAPYFSDANLLIAADCTAYAYGDFHRRFIRDHITLVGCPKLDEEDYSEKLAAIIANNSIKSITVVRMEVPCCGGLQRAAEEALRRSGKQLPLEVITISTHGEIK